MPDFDSTTQDHPPRDREPSPSSGPDSFAPDHRLIEGGGSKMASETQRLLQQRLRAASLVLVFGFGLFFLRSLVLHKPESLTVMFHGLLLALLVLSLALLSSSWRPTLRELRIFEVSLFATLIAFFMAAEYVLMLKWVRNNNPMYFLAAVKSSVLWTFSMILTYAIFIPNTWRRAAKVVVPMALVPMVVPWVLGMLHPESYAVALWAANVEQVSEHGLFLLLGAFTAIFGTHIINKLRTQAFTARLLNQYRLGRKLGVGGMGEVFLAEHQMLKRPCAIKLIRQEHSADPHAMARFEREVRATAQLSHWNTIEIFDYGRNDDGAFYYVMEYLPGLSLDAMVRRHGPMPPARVIYLLRQACDALNEAHDAGLIHRDIKPANLFAAYRGGLHDVTKLLDFGLVKTLQGAGSIQLSQEDTVAGSPLYIAPEQVMHTQPPDRRTDIYAIGAVAYFLLAGRPPFLGDSAMEVMIAHTRDPVPPLSVYCPEIPSDLEQVVRRCLSKKPGDRFPDTASLSEALGACGDAVNWSPRHAAEWWRAHQGLTELDPVSQSAPTEPRIREADEFQYRSGESVSDSALESAKMPPMRNSRPRPVPSFRSIRREAMQPTPTYHESHDERAGHNWMTEPLDVTVHLAFAFDIGDEIDLDRARLILQGEPGQLPRRRRTPESIGYRPAPIRVEVVPEGLRLPGDPSLIRPPRAELTLFDFGAISLSVQFPMTASPAALTELAGRLAEPAPLTEATRRLLEPWLRQIRPAVYDYAFSEMSEEYIVFQLAGRRTGWLEHRADWIAGLVRLESGPLSRSEVREAVRMSLDYTPTDLVVLDWAAGFVADTDCADTLQIIEFANVQLLEFRHIDDRLDDRLEAAYRLIRPERRQWTPRFWRLHGDAMRQIREMEIEATSLFERVDNSLKLIGDHYLARVFEVASTRFHLRGWQQSIRRKLETVGSVYDLLVQQAGGQRTEALEIIVIVLIALEIVLAVLRH